MAENQNIKLKVCGMREPENIREAFDNGLDYMGFIFYPKSSRYVGEDFDPAIVRGLPDRVKKVGVFVNAAPETVRQAVATYGLDLLQLHGEESPEYCRDLRQEGVQLIKVFGVGEHFDFDRLQPYAPYVEYYLFDTKGKDRGGNGYAFDWSILDRYDNSKPIFLSGGLSLENITLINDLDHIDIHALDVNSRFEISPGLKDIDKLEVLNLIISDLEFGTGDR